MAITSGTRLGPYEIESLLGSGGMGEVYRALDTRLQRSVAVKVLPAAVAADQKRLARFEQEARTLAALNHPNVLVAYDIGMFEGAPYVVSELLEGETLRDSIHDEAPLSIRTVIDYGQQMAKGLAAAHERGIVHRDLKPENVFVTRDGRVKILDFGLAKLSQSSTSVPAVAVAPTEVETEAGTVLGTVGYMSPEQVRGLDADHRSDIFSFGAILYELVTGRRAFHGATRADTMTAVLKEEPPELGGGGRPLPPGLVRIIGRCLEKEPERRFQSSSDLAFALEAVSVGSGSESAPATVARPPSPRRYAPGLLGVAVVAGAMVLLAALPYLPRGASDPGPEPIVGRFTLTPPAGVRFAPGGAQPGPRFALSPDGRSVALVGQAENQTAIWLRPLGAAQLVRVPGTDGVIGTPFWSPDGKSLAFFTQSGLTAIDLTTGTSRTICDVKAFGPQLEGAWGASAIVITMPSGFNVCPVSGGTPSAQFVYAGPKKFPVPGARPSHPRFLPDGRRFIFAMRAPDANYNGIFLGEVTDARVETATLVLADRSVATFAAGHLLFVRDGVLMAQPFDPATAALSSQPRPVTRSVEFEDAHAARLAASGSVLLYTTGDASRAELRWAGPQGVAGDPAIPAGDYGDFSLAPDGTRIAIVRRDAKLNLRVLWALEVATAGWRRLSGQAGGADSSPVWSPDGETVAFSRHLPSRSSLVTVPAAGGPETELLVEVTDVPREVSAFEPLDWSANPSLLMYRDAMGSLWVLPMSTEPRTPAKIDTRGRVFAARFSPDGKWIAYAAAETSVDVYIEPWPQTGKRWMISGRDGGSEPRWAPGGRQLFYRSGRGGIMVVDFPARGPAAPLTPRPFVSITPGDGARSGSYAVTRDGRLVVMTAVEREDSIVTLLNWTRLLEE